MDNQVLFALLKTNDEQRKILVAELCKLDWQHIAANGFEVEAILCYYRKHGGSLVEARTKVKSFMELIK
jgi:hypothetical protein